MKINKNICSCGCKQYDKGRAFDGRRAYRCKSCGGIHTAGMQNRNKKYSQQREGNQFLNSNGKGHIE